MVVQPLQNSRKHRRMPRLLPHPPDNRRGRLPPRQGISKVRGLNTQLLSLLTREIRRRPSPPHIPSKQGTLTGDRIERRRVIRQRVLIDRTAIAAGDQACEYAGQKQSQQPNDYVGQPPAKTASARRGKRDPAIDAHDNEPNHCLASPMVNLGSRSSNTREREMLRSRHSEWAGCTTWPSSSARTRNRVGTTVRMRITLRMYARSSALTKTGRVRVGYRARIDNDADLRPSGPDGPWNSAAALTIESAAGKLAHELADQLDLEIDVVITAKGAAGEDDISIAMSALPTISP
jgi:hypothetical protein